jgi:uridine phosphorylase
MLTFELEGVPIGIVGCAVGAPFAVLVAEQMFSSGCRLLLSVTSAGRIAPHLPDSACFVLIDRALRDEGTSYHYVRANDIFAHADPALAGSAADAIAAAGLPVLRGAVWTTDAPFRETEEAIAWAGAQGVLAVEMEAAALYAFAQARQAAVLCFAHVTNRMAQVEGDFEKGEADGADDALSLLATVVIAARAKLG